MADKKKANNVTKKSIEGANGFFKGSKLCNSNYKVLLNTSKSCKVNVLDTTANTVKNGGKSVDWVFRIDKPHGRVDYNHININPKYSGLPTDPHVPILAGAVTAAEGAAKVCKVINKIALPVAITVDTIRMGVAIYEDVENDTSRNTVETVASIAGGWGGGFGGAAGGAAIGTAIFPGIGTVIGGIIGGVSCGIGGALGAASAVEAIGDVAGYDVVEVYCKLCGKKFIIRLYQGERRNKYCPKCVKQKKNYKRA